MSDDQLCTFDGEHGNIREHIDIDGYFFIGEKENRKKQAVLFVGWLPRSGHSLHTIQR